MVAREGGRQDENELQREVHRMRKERGFVMDPLKILALLFEEAGEVACALMKEWSVNDHPFQRGRPGGGDRR